MAVEKSVEEMISVENVDRSDIPIIKEIETECGLSRWAIEDYYAELENPESVFLIVRFGKNAAGFILARLITNKPEVLTDLSGENEAEIYNFAVREEFRRKKLGSVLLKSFIETAGKKSIAKIFLEVRKSNFGAIRFYQTNMFEQVGERRNFYSDPVEDAVLMCCRPKS